MAGSARAPAPSKWSNVSRKKWKLMKKGEIWRVLIPAAAGHAQTGERPSLLLHELAFNTSLPTTLIVPLTSKLAASRFDGTWVIQPDPQNGLTAPSVALVFQMRTLDRRNCLKQME